MKVIIASENPVKVAVAKRTFASVFSDDEFEYIAVKSESGVPDQPMNDETEQGALNRLVYIQERHPDADYWISQEGGVYTDGDRLVNRAWIMVTDRSGYVGKSSTSSFYLPTPIIELIKEGVELGHAVDQFFSTVNSKHGVGAVGILTDDIVDREHYYHQAAVIALSELKHKDWYEVDVN